MKLLRTSDQLQPEGGFTLIELLVAMALTAIFSLMLADLFTNVLAAQTEYEATSAVAQDGRYILQRLSYDVTRASAIVDPATLGGSGSSLELTIGGVSNTYDLAGGNLELTNGAGTANLNGDQTTISDWSVQRLGEPGQPDTARISFTVTSKAMLHGQASTQHFSLTAGRR
ncbi:MAG TPA: prepilin-type N-terminal cleavage/methylation domain-containing protein [Candidatus Saccharimonas sp.]|nr:prepilin-type N-terminal cleavage/methylation domain-containing protein [Candidatus Saccharimonas sp.]